MTIRKPLQSLGNTPQWITRELYLFRKMAAASRLLRRQMRPVVIARVYTRIPWV